MRWSSAVSEAATLAEAVEECAAILSEQLEGESPDMVVAFASAHHAGSFADVPSLVGAALPGGVLIGCSSGGVIGAGAEVEHRPGFAMTAARLPGVSITPFHVEDAVLPDGDAPPQDWEALFHASSTDDPQFLLLADPFSVRGEFLLMGLDFAFPGSVKIGGLASGGSQPGSNALFLGDEVHRGGVVGLAFSGDIVIDTVVAQGCRPIGAPMQITGCQRNVLIEVDGQTPFEALKGVFAGLSDRDRQLAQHSLFLGIVMDEMNESPLQGDFLIRNIVGVDGQRGFLAIGEMLKEGQIVQFHLRDADTSAQDLDAVLERYLDTHAAHGEAGALLFSCLGRGSYLYGRADHDTDMFRDKLGPMPLTGFFCNGEIGQVGGSTYLHGYTSSFGVFRPKTDLQA